MEPHGIYPLSVDHREAASTFQRVGLVKERTGIPVFLLYLEESQKDRRKTICSVEDIETEIYQHESSGDKAAWQTMLPFFEADGSSAHVVCVPLTNDKSLPSLLGQDLGLSRRSGIHVLKSFTEIADLVVIPQVSQWLGHETSRLFYRSLLDTLSPLQHFFFLLDLPKATSLAQAELWLKGMLSPDAAVYYPWIISGERCLPPTPLAAAAFQLNDALFHINDLPANRALKGTFFPMIRLGPHQLQECASLRLNLVHRFSDEKLCLWGGRTLADPFDWDARFISNRRTLLAIREAVLELTEPFVLEPLHVNLPRTVDIALQSAFQNLRKVFDPAAKQPFQTDITIKNSGGEDVLDIRVSFRIPYAVDEMSFTIGLS
jgi:hypothetical protein